MSGRARRRTARLRQLQRIYHHLEPSGRRAARHAVEAIVDNRSQRTEQNLREAMETRVTALETKIDTLTKMLQTLIDNQQS